jgi:branched-chain amino acid aminotransferase
LLFGKNNTDHMIEVDWEKETGWGVPKLIPFEPLKLHPFSSTLHYGIQCFEGMKAYKNDKG